jgi:hypothetical protein
MLIVVFLSGCLTAQEFAEQYTNIAGCYDVKIKIIVSDDEWEEDSRTWMASGCGREHLCIRGMDRAICKETEESLKRATKGMLEEFLSMRTGCKESDVKLVRTSKWSVGGVFSHELSACGVRYLCRVLKQDIKCAEVKAKGGKEAI